MKLQMILLCSIFSVTPSFALGDDYFPDKTDFSDETHTCLIANYFEPLIQGSGRDKHIYGYNVGFKTRDGFTDVYFKKGHARGGVIDAKQPGKAFVRELNHCLYISTPLANPLSNQ